MCGDFKNFPKFIGLPGLLLKLEFENVCLRENPKTDMCQVMRPKRGKNGQPGPLNIPGVSGSRLGVVNDEGRDVAFKPCFALSLKEMNSG